jgi:hypothetical protein
LVNSTRRPALMSLSFSGSPPGIVRVYKFLSILIRRINVIDILIDLLGSAAKKEPPSRQNSLYELPDPDFQLVVW